MKYKFRIYISMLNDETLTNIDMLKISLDSRFEENYELEIIDVLNSPNLIKTEDSIFATPTIIRVSPLPVKKVVGDISRKEE
ncbi:MAG: circadian clock KaiB family protein, partial [Thermodesulfobacteriota bacterium]